jgi:hypothetical protein
LFYRGAHVGTLHQQIATREWWADERKFFELYSSVFTEGELRHGSFPGQRPAVALCRRLSHLPMSNRVRECARVLLDARVVPPNKPGDAVQLAFAIVHEIDYLLTWNYAHLANLDTQRKLDAMSRHHGWRTPYLVSPETIPRQSLGQTIRRKKREDTT